MKFLIVVFSLLLLSCASNRKLTYLDDSNYIKANPNGVYKLQPDDIIHFDIIEEGDHVICAVTGKTIALEELNYWNVDLQEPYYSYKEAAIKREGK